MRAHRIGLWGCLLALPLASPAIAAPTMATAALVDAAGKAVGTATLTESKQGLRLKLKASGLPAGEHGVHLHAVGQCDAPEFKTAGGHWNPSGKMHGKDNPAGMHMGDLPNMTVAANGTGTIDAQIAGARLTGGAAPLLDADGAALVIHATADDYKTDPSGNSGARIACGVVRLR